MGCECDQRGLDGHPIPCVPKGAVGYPLRIPTPTKIRHWTTEAGRAIEVHRRSRSMHGGVDLAIPHSMPVWSGAARPLDASAPTARLLLLLVAPILLAERAMWVEGAPPWEMETGEIFEMAEHKA